MAHAGPGHMQPLRPTVDLGPKIQGSGGVPGWESIPSGIVGGFGAGSKRKGELWS